MNVIIDDTWFPFDTGIRLLKTKYAECIFPEIADIWDRIEPLRLVEINDSFVLFEHKRIAFRCLGIERLITEVKPVLICSETVSKTTTWLESDGTFTRHDYSDTYELFRVRWSDLFGNTDPADIPHTSKVSHHFVKCRDTSTGREHVIWVDILDIHRTNHDETTGPFPSGISRRRTEQHVNPVQAIAWTITTNIPFGNIDRIMRQGDCILIRPIRPEERLKEPRHLTELEYRKHLYGEA